MLLPIPDHVTLTLTTQGESMIANGLQVDKIAIGTSTDEPSSTDTSLQKEVADFPTYTSIENGKTKIHTAIEYGSLLGIHEIGLYIGGFLVATINKETNRVNNQALILVKYKRVYLLTIEIDNAKKTVVINADERDDLTYAIAMTLQKVQSDGGLVRPSRIGQVLTSKVVDNKLVAVWDDLANVPQTSSEFIPQADGSIESTDTTGLFTGLTNATYTAIDKYDPNNHLQPKDASKPYGGDLSLGENGFVFKFNSQNDSVTFKTSTGVDIVFKNNFDGTATVTDGSQELITLNYTEDGQFRLGNGNDFLDVSIGYSDFNGWTDIKLPGTELAGCRNLTSMTIDGSAPTTFFVQLPL